MLQHNENNRECGGGTRGLAGLPWVAAEDPEGYWHQITQQIHFRPIGVGMKYLR